MYKLTKTSLSKKEEFSIKNYSYKSIDRSFLSSLIFQKYTKFILSYTPTNLSPNLITLCGFLSMLFSFILTLIFDLNLTNKENWLPFLNAIFLFFYFTMDNLDGAQARKLNEMSPMGQLFDHGVDSCAVFFCLIGVISSYQFGYSYTSVMCIISVMFGFYLSGLEEKYTGIFEFGYISAPTEGMMLVIGMHLFSSFWDKHCKNLSQILTHCAQLTRIIPQLKISPLFILALIVFLYNFLTSFIKSLRCKKYKSIRQICFSYISILPLIIPLIIFHNTFENSPTLKMINFIIFAQNFSLKYVDEIFTNMIGTKPILFNLNFVIYIFFGIVAKYIDKTKIFMLLLFSTSYYIVSMYVMILSCHKALKINILHLNNTKKN